MNKEETNVFGMNITAIKGLIKELQDVVDNEPNIIRAVNVEQHFNQHYGKSIMAGREITITLTK